MNNKQQKSIHSRLSKPGAILLITVVVLTITAFTYVKSSHPQQPKTASGTIKTSDTSATTNVNDPVTNTDSIAPDKSSAGSQSSSTTTLIAPYGSFVSNHKPGQNGSDLKELSQCITSPGATCYIKFTQAGVVKTLPTKTANSTGSIEWEWDIADAGLNSGNWTIQAITVLGDRMESTTDQLSLEIQ